MKNGTPIKDKKGWVHFGAGQLREFEFKKWQAEQEAIKAKETKERRQKEREEREKKLKSERRKESMYVEKILKIKEDVEKKRDEIRELTDPLLGIKREKVSPRWIVKKVSEINKNIEETKDIEFGPAFGEVAHNSGFTKDGLENFLKKYYNAKNFESYRKIVLSRTSVVKDAEGVREQRKIKDWVQLPKGYYTFKDRLDAGIDPIVSTEDKSTNERWYPAPGILRWSNEIAIIRNRTLQPVKRIRIIAHSFLSAGNWSNGRQVLNVSCKLAEGEDKYLTAEGGIIISQKFAMEENMRKGDKILGINGLKGIVSDIRKQSEALIINRNEVWNVNKMSRLCGGALVEIADGNLKIFYQPDKKIRDTGIIKKVRYSPDLVPFIAYYLSKEELAMILSKNAKKFQDVMYMLNLAFTEEKGKLVLTAKTTQPGERKGGKLYPFGKTCWSSTKKESYLSDKPIKWKDKDIMLYPFVMEKIWVPDWFMEEYHTHFEKDKKTGEVVEEVDDLIKKLTHPDEFINFGDVAMRLMYKYIFRETPDSIGSLTAVAKNTKPNVVELNEELCKKKDINEGDSILVLRYPVVSRLNVQKMVVAYADVPEKAIAVNVESMRLLYGDFDGDTLNLLKIPQTLNFAKVFSVPGKTYKEERTKIDTELAELESSALPTEKPTNLRIDVERQIKIVQSRTFIETMVKDGFWNKKKLEIFDRDVQLKPTGYIRSDDELIKEAKNIHENLDKSGPRAEKAGTLTKWFWFVAGKNKKISEEIMAEIASLEIIKDRAGVKNEEEFKKSIEILDSYRKSLYIVDKKTGKLRPPFVLVKFKDFVSAHTYDIGKVGRMVKLRDFRGKPTVDVRTPYAKFVLVLQGKSQ